ncbi:MAG TPA: class II glutamine amidotransferase, partial [Candidatus Woesebacteria bacterium]|nr:class II glutamine amidotransferase [Candidatus Woesebacteria bacterium]
MCGIFGYIGTKNNSGALILDGLKTLEYRGYDSWGVAVKKDDQQIYIEKHTGKIGDAHLPNMKAHMGIGHTRWATHGGVTDANAHPHISCDKKVIVVHNGIVENFDSLKNNLLKKGHTFTSQTDSEVIVHLIEEIMKKETDLLRVMNNMWKQLHGMNAVIAFFPEQEQIYVVKNGSPIVYGKAPDGEYIASDTSALIIHTKQVYFLEDNEMLTIDKNGTSLYRNNKKVTIPFTTLSYDKTSANLGDFTHFMMKELNEQPKILQHIIDTQTHN